VVTGDQAAGQVAGRHALYAYLVAAALVASLVRIDVDVPLVGHLGSALVAITLLYAPVVVAWRRKEDLFDYGFHPEPIKRGLAFGFGYVALIFPLFAFGYLAFYELACSPSAPAWLHQLAPIGACKSFHGLAGLHAPAITMDLAQFVAVQLVVVALPEELFFRGCLHGLLEKRFPPKRKLLGGGIGLALVLSSLMFALIHLPKNGDPRALATFFPGLVFGWMRSSTGSILGPVVAHASSNVLVRVLDLMVLR
jgi:hypothetical protein